MIPVVITGDTHGEYGRLLEIHRRMEQYDTKEKYLLVCGDFGYLFKNDFSEHRLLDEIEQQDYTVVVVPGNHENYNEFMQYDIVDFHGAKAYQVRKNIFYILRGEIFELGTKAFFCMGGGYSIDCYMRQKDVSWWEEEMPTDAEYRHAADNLEAYRTEGKKIDYILSHTAPLSGLRYLKKDHGAEEYPLNNFLEYVQETLGEEYTCHYFGHLHVDEVIPFHRMRALWFDYEELMLPDDKTLEK
ncbi:MAG: metallophosphoesterase [Clostridia bacterium]|nr:metallophosphoesterase [Clostridia bacterium]